MRTFFCVPLSESVRRAVAAAAERLREDLALRASWVRPGNYHLTLRFLGEVEPALTVDLDRVARELARKTEPFDVRVDRVGAFPSVGRARVLWVGGEGPDAYGALVEALNGGLRTLGFRPERRETVAHVTVARLKQAPDASIERAFARVGTLKPETMRVDRIVLMESRLSPTGAEYTPLCEAKLGGA
jgi:2'-5' RNA ligase